MLRWNIPMLRGSQGFRVHLCCGGSHLWFPAYRNLIFPQRVNGLAEHRVLLEHPFLLEMIRMKKWMVRKRKDGPNHDKRWEEMKTLCFHAQARLGMIDHPFWSMFTDQYISQMTSPKDMWQDVGSKLWRTKGNAKKDWKIRQQRMSTESSYPTKSHL